MPLDFVCVKKEIWDGVNEALTELYAGHEVTEELVLGPEVLQPADVAFRIRDRVRGKQPNAADAAGAPESCLEALRRRTFDSDRVKQEPSFEPPMVQIHSFCDYNDLHPKPYVKKEPADLKPLQKLLEKHRAVYNITPCFVPLVDILKKTNARITIDKSLDEKKRKPKKFFCDYCGKGFAMKQSLLVHIRVHTREKPFGCHVCNKMFSDDAILIRHRRIHTGVKPYTCDVCQKRFGEKYLLRYHKRLHTGETPYVCQSCPKTFNHISNLKRHTRSHENKPFSCQICYKNFADQSKLELHLATHLKSKPYECDVCQKCFVKKEHLKTHLGIHFGVKKYCCKTCKVRFSQPTSLKRHALRNVCGKW